MTEDPAGKSARFAWSHPGHDALAGMLRQRCGLVFQNLTVRSAEAAFRDAMAAAGVADPWIFAERVEADPDEFARLVDAVTIGETYFFRDPDHYQFLRNEVAPRLRARDGSIRAWSAGCASGEEAYSLAMFLRSEGLGERSRVLGTDLSRAALARARAGRYNRWSLRPPAAQSALPFLNEDAAGAHVVCELVARMVDFAEMNLVSTEYPSFANGTMALDLILCRNVLLYLDPELVPGILARLLQCLVPGGWLLIGPTDLLQLGTAPPGSTIECAGTVLRRDLEPDVSNRETRRGSPPIESGSAGPYAPPQAPGSPEFAPPADEAEAQDMTAARQAFAAGDYARSSEIAARHRSTIAATLCVRALANLDLFEAEKAAAAALGRDARSVELGFLHGMLLARLGRDAEARDALEATLRHDESLVIARFILAAVLLRLGRPDGARREYRRVMRLCRRWPEAAVLPFSDGQPAGWIGESALEQLDLLKRLPGARRGRSLRWPPIGRSSRSGAA